MILPSKQVGKSQRCAARLPVQPDTEIVPGGLGRQPSLKALEEESEVTVHWGSALFMHLRAGTETMGDIIATTNLIRETLAAGTYTVEVISRAARPLILVFSGLEMPEDPPEPPPTVEDLLTVDVSRAAGAGDAAHRLFHAVRVLQNAGERVLPLRTGRGNGVGKGRLPKQSKTDLLACDRNRGFSQVRSCIAEPL